MAKNPDQATHFNAEPIIFIISVTTIDHLADPELLHLLEPILEKRVNEKASTAGGKTSKDAFGKQNRTMIK